MLPKVSKPSLKARQYRDSIFPHVSHLLFVRQQGIQLGITVVGGATGCSLKHRLSLMMTRKHNPTKLTGTAGEAEGKVKERDWPAVDVLALAKPNEGEG